MKNNLAINLDEQYWFDGDKFLSYIIRKELKSFCENFDLLEEPPLSLMPECRHYAREKFLHKESLNKIAIWCSEAGDSEEIDYECVGYFFWEETELMFAKLFLERFKEHVKNENLDDIKEILVDELIGLDGASFKKLAMKKWS